MKLRNYLTVYTAEGTALKPTLYQSTFYIAKVVKTLVDIEQLQDYGNQHADFIYISHKAIYGKVMTGVTTATTPDVQQW